MVYRGIRRNGAGEPNISANGGVMSDNRFSPQDGGSGIDDHVILNNRMPLRIGHVLFYAQRAKSDSLIKFYMFPYPARLPDHDSRSVVDMEVFIDKSTRVDIDARLGVRIFR